MKMQEMHALSETMIALAGFIQHPKITNPEKEIHFLMQDYGKHWPKISDELRHIVAQHRRGGQSSKRLINRWTHDDIDETKRIVEEHNLHHDYEGWLFRDIKSSLIERGLWNNSPEHADG